MRSGRLIALENLPAVRPFGVGETWRRLMSKCLLRVMGQEAKSACGTEQLDGGVDARIEGAVYAI